MTKPTKTIRREMGLIEAVCEHRVGHPVYGSAHWLGLQRHDTETWLVHGCDGCCLTEEWRKANKEYGNGQREHRRIET